MERKKGIISLLILVFRQRGLLNWRGSDLLSNLINCYETRTANQINVLNK